MNSNDRAANRRNDRGVKAAPATAAKEERTKALIARTAYHARQVVTCAVSRFMRLMVAPRTAGDHRDSTGDRKIGDFPEGGVDKRR